MVESGVALGLQERSKPKRERDWERFDKDVFVVNAVKSTRGLSQSTEGPSDNAYLMSDQLVPGRSACYRFGSMSK